MEKGTVIGIGAGLALVFLPILTGAGTSTFFDIPSILLVLGGTVAALLINFTLDEVKQVPGGVKEFFSFQAPDMNGFVKQFGELSRVARREGVLALDRQIDDIDDDVMKMGLEMIVDGIEEKEVTELLDVRIKQEIRARRLTGDVFNQAGLYAPSFGMIGTLIGLIQMLQALDDPAKIGAGMSVAMITTFYGALFANLFFLPFSAKMKVQTSEVQKARNLVKVGILSIVKGDSPTMVEKRLRLFIGGGDPNDAEVVDDGAMKKAA